MGSWYQTILAIGERAEIEQALEAMGVQAVTQPVAPGRWSVAPQEDENNFAETEEIAERLSLLPSGLAAAFQVHDSDALTAQLFRDGEGFHSYLSDQSVLVEWWDEDDNELLFNLLGQPWTGDGTPPPTAIGNDANLFAPFGVGDIDLSALQRSLTEPQPLAERQHAGILKALNLDPRPLMTPYRDSKR